MTVNNVEVNLDLDAPNSGKWKAKLNREQVIEIRRIRKEDGLSCVKIAKMFGISRGCVQGIIEGYTWKGVGE